MAGKERCVSVEEYSSYVNEMYLVVAVNRVELEMTFRGSFVCGSNRYIIHNT
jgi:hypothetical protein